MPLSSAFYSDAQPPSVFYQPQADNEMSAYQPPPVPDLFRRPMTPAMAQPQGNFLDRQNAQPQQQPQQQEQPQSDPNAQQGGGGAQTASQMAQALLLYQMLQGGPNQFLGQLGIGAGSGFGQRLGQQGQAFQGLQDPSVQGLFQKQSYFKPSLSNAMRMGQDPGAFRQMYGGGPRGDQRSQAALAPNAYESAIEFLRGLLGLA